MGARRRLRVLVADDEPAMRFLYRLNLEAEGMEVSEAGDGETALALVRSERPDLIVLDLMMPRLDAWAVAEQLLQDPQTRAIPIVFASAHAAARQTSAAHGVLDDHRVGRQALDRLLLRLGNLHRQRPRDLAV